MPDELWVPDSVASRRTGGRRGSIELNADVKRALELGRTGAVDDPTLNDMRRNRAVNQRLAGRDAAQGGPSLSFATGRPKDPMFYWRQNNLPYDVNKPEELQKIRAYCNTPDAPVLMADGTFKPIGEIQVGEEVMGWEWRTAERGKRKRLVPTRVLATKRREAPMVVEATMESGRVIRCTPDHQWANYWYSSNPTTNEYEPLVRPSKGGHGGPVRFNTMCSLVAPVAPLVDRKEIDAAGYLAGIIDADGTVTNGEIRIGQSPEVNQPICDRIEAALNVLGLDYRVHDRTPGVRIWVLKATLENRARLRTWMPWSVKVEKAWTDRLGWAGSSDRVAEVVELGPGEVVSMQTTTGNYIAWGYGSRNCRLLYLTHPIIASAIDIYSKYPLTGMELVCKDTALTDFYSTLFLDQLKYPKFLKTLAREYWTVGEAWPFGSFNETLGVWEADELLNPNDIEVHRSPFLAAPSFEMRLPETLRRVLQERKPQWEYDTLIRSYPELANFLGENSRMPVSNILLRQIRFDADTFNPRGVPILMRGFRAVMQEEMLNAAQDAVADRLYTPLILAKLGASASDLGTNAPWIPTESDLMNFEESLDAALAADFRVLTHHFAVEMDTVFGREAMPNLTPDFDRLMEKQLQVFGLSKTMISGGGAGETYAADALNRDLISMLLTDLQDLAIDHYKQRALIVAEAQEHYDFEVRGGKRYPIMEEVLEVDEETGQQRIVEQPKLLIPDMRIKSMNVKNEEAFRQFIEAARESGVPISQKTRMVNVPVDLEEEREAVMDEQVEQALDAARVRRRTYEGLRDEGLPIPQDLEAEFRPKASTGEGNPHQQTTEDGAIPTLGTVEPASDAALVPDAAERAALQGSDVANDKVVQMLPRNRALEGQPHRPPESDEMRAGMPRASSASPTEYVDRYGYGHEVTGAMISGPKHVGSRRNAAIDKTKPLDDEPEVEQAG